MNQPPKGKSLIAKRSVFIGPRKTSVTIELPFWEALKEIAAEENLSLNALVTRINGGRQHPNLSSAIRRSCWITMAGWRRSAPGAWTADA